MDYTAKLISVILDKGSLNRLTSLVFI